jgi:hypothetical protein
MSAIRRPLRIVTALILGASTRMYAQGQYVCPLAPVHGPICRYVDPRLLQALSNEAQAELLRWVTLRSIMPEVERLIDRTRHATGAIATFDSTLRLIKTPRVRVPQVFAAAWNLTHPEATVRLRLAGDQLVAVHVAEVAASALAREGTAGDPVLALARAVRTMGQSVPWRTTDRITQRISEAYQGDVEARARHSAAIDASQAFAARVRGRSEGMTGEGEAAVLAAKAQIDLLRVVTDERRADATEFSVQALALHQTERERRGRALGAVSILLWPTP